MDRLRVMFLSLVVFLFSVLISQISLAGVVIEQVMKDREGNASKVVLSISGERVRTDDVDNGLSTIMDFKGDKMMMVDHRAKNYVAVKFSQWEKEVAERLKKDLPGVQPKARRIVVRRAGETATINGFRTEKVEVLADGELIEENWVTREVDLSDVEKVMERMSQGFSTEFRSGMAEARDIHEKLKPYGFPIRVRDYSVTYGLKGVDVLEVKKIEQRELKDDVFSPPAGYASITLEPSKK
jgi:hypothetical protein